MEKFIQSMVEEYGTSDGRNRKLKYCEEGSLMGKVMFGFGTALLVMLIVGCLALFSAFTISTLWAWFIVPLGVVKIGFAHAYGVSLLSTVLMGARGIDDDSVKIVVQGITINLLALLLGWIAVGLM